MQKLFFSFIFLIFTFRVDSQNPSLTWVRKMGGISNDEGRSLAIDAKGNIYTTGYFYQTADFNPDTGIYDLTCASVETDIFISKLDPDGNFVWAKKVGGINHDEGMSISIDSFGNVYTVGWFSGKTDFDPGAGTFNLTSKGVDMFILKLDSSGNFIWAKNMGGTKVIVAYSIAIDKSGNVYITGGYRGTVDFDPGVGVFNLSSLVGTNIFISKLDAAGNFIWAKTIKGNQGESYGSSITIDIVGNIYTTGTFFGTHDFDPGVDTFNLTSVGMDIFILKLDSSGNLLWVKTISGDGTNLGSAILTDKHGNVYNAGSYSKTADFDPGVGTYNYTANGENDIYISKLTSNGDFLWAKTIGGLYSDYGLSMDLDKDNNVYTTGHYTDLVDFDPGAATYYLNSGTIFISKLDSSGNFIWATQNMKVFGVGSSIKLDKKNNIYTSGNFSIDGDFEPGFNEIKLTTKGAEDIFIQKINQNAPSSSIKSDYISNTISIYPNPTNGTFNLTLQNLDNITRIEIYNTLGELVYKQTTLNQSNKIDLNNYACGLYFVKVIIRDHSFVAKKVIKY